MTEVGKNDMEMIQIARKYGIAPGTVKCEVFSLFDRGFTPKEVRFILRGKGGINNSSTFSNTINRYHYAWRKAQKKIPDRNSQA